MTDITKQDEHDDALVEFQLRCKEAESLLELASPDQCTSATERGHILDAAKARLTAIWAAFDLPFADRASVAKHGVQASTANDLPAPSAQPHGDQILIVCRDQACAHETAETVNRSASNIEVSWPSMAALHAFTPRVIIIAPDVNLKKDIEGQGTLESILRARQMIWGERAEFIVMH